MKYYFGSGKRKTYFEGWYYKQQNQTDVIAVIPAFHTDKKGNRSASVQVITKDKSYHKEYSISECRISEQPFEVQIGMNLFRRNGCRLSLRMKDGKWIRGVLHYRNLMRPAYDIMGPFAKIPFMQCRHSVFSMRHHVHGWMSVGTKRLYFENGVGYMEGDRGRSFPKRYIWTNCNQGKCSVMLSVADIPFGLLHFNGCIGFVLLGNREYRFATYLGAQICKISKTTVMIRQKDMILGIRLIKACGQELKAPFKGSMDKTIHESVACKVRCTLVKSGEIIMDFTSNKAGYENEWV